MFSNISKFFTMGDLDKGMRAYNRGDFGTASRELKLLAKLGDAEAQFYLGLMCGRKYDHLDAEKWFKLAAEQGHAKAQTNLGWICGNRKHASKDERNEMVKWYRLAAEQGDARGQSGLGKIYTCRNYDGISQDYQEALKWYRRGAEQGDADAQNCLGEMYYDGLGVSQDYKEAFKWYRLSAEQGYTEAQFKLTKMYSRGKGVAKNNIITVMWYDLAILDNAEIHRNYLKDRLYFDTRDLWSFNLHVQDEMFDREHYVKSITFEQMAMVEKMVREWVPKNNRINLSSPPGVADPADNFHNGCLAYVTGDYATALSKWQPLAENGHVTAQYNLGLMCETGQSIQQDDKQAAKWIKLAAEQGHEQAQYNLGMMYAVGQGVSQNDILAYIWFNRAESNGVRGSTTQKQILQLQMPPEQLEQAENLVEEWIAKSKN